MCTLKSLKILYFFSDNVMYNKHRTCVTLQEMRHLRLPSIVEIFPSMFVPVTTVSKMEQEAKKSTPDQVSVSLILTCGILYLQ